MITQFIERHLKWLVSAALLITVVGLCLAPTAFAKISLNTIDAQAIVTDNGRHLIVTGPIQCTAGERVSIGVTVTQRSTGAVAEGIVAFECSGAVEQWDVDATTQGKAVFQPGPATAVALGRTTIRGNTTDAHQWLVDINLVSQ